MKEISCHKYFTNITTTKDELIYKNDNDYATVIIIGYISHSSSHGHANYQAYGEDFYIYQLDNNNKQYLYCCLMEDTRDLNMKISLKPNEEIRFYQESRAKYHYHYFSINYKLILDEN